MTCFRRLWWRRVQGSVVVESCAGMPHVCGGLWLAGCGVVCVHMPGFNAGLTQRAHACETATHDAPAESFENRTSQRVLFCVACNSTGAHELDVPLAILIRRAISGEGLHH